MNVVVRPEVEQDICELRRRGEDGAAEEVFEIAAEDNHRQLTHAFEITLEAEAKRVRAPRLDPGIVDLDTVRWAGQRLGVGQGGAAVVLVVARTAERLIVGAAEDEVVADIVARVEARQHAEVFLLGARAAAEIGEPRVVEPGGGGDNERGQRATGRVAHDVAGGIAARDDVAARVALEGARRISERAPPFDVGLLGAPAAGELEAAREELGVGAEADAAPRRFDDYKPQIKIRDDALPTGVTLHRMVG